MALLFCKHFQTPALAFVLLATARCGSTAPPVDNPSAVAGTPVATVQVAAVAADKPVGPGATPVASIATAGKPVAPAPGDPEPGCPRKVPAVGVACAHPDPGPVERPGTIGTLGYCHYDAQPPMCSRVCSCEKGHWGCYDAPCTGLPGAPAAPPAAGKR